VVDKVQELMQHHPFLVDQEVQVVEEQLKAEAEEQETHLQQVHLKEIMEEQLNQEVLTKTQAEAVLLLQVIQVHLEETVEQEDPLQ
jgi:hypothetical protein